MRLLAFLWDLVGLLLLVVLFIEFSLDPLRRFMRSLRDRSTEPNLSPEPAAPHSRVEAIARAMHLDWAPYVHWRQSPYQNDSTTVDDRGLRRTIGEDPNDAAAIRIACFGSSTLFCLGVRDEATIPSVLQKLLVANGRRVAVSNHAQLAYNSSQGLLAFQQLLKHGTVPDIVLFYDGFNDMFAAEWKGHADAIRGEEARRAEFFLLGRDRRRALFGAALASLIPRTLRRLHEWTGYRMPGELPDAARIPLRENDIARLAREVVAVYVTNLRTVRALSREYGFVAIFVWEPTLATKQVKSAEEEGWERDRMVDLAVRRKFFTAVIEEYRNHPAVKNGPDIVDLSALFDARAEPLYIDFAHLSEAGLAEVAEAMLPAVSRAIDAVRQGRDVLTP